MSESSGKRSSERGSIGVEGGVAVDGGNPFVMVSWEGEEPQAQMTPAEAVQLGFQLIESAIEAERDAGFVAFFRSANYDDQTTGALLFEMRNHRQQHRVEGFDQKGRP